MRARDRQDIVEEVVESNADPAGWRAIAGDRRDGLGEDLFLGHPDAGVFQLKTYARTPFDVQGVGGEVARRIDDDLDPLFPDEDDGGRFGVQSAPEDEDAETEVAEELEAVIETHADAPTTGPTNSTTSRTSSRRPTNCSRRSSTTSSRPTAWAAGSTERGPVPPARSCYRYLTSCVAYNRVKMSKIDL